MHSFQNLVANDVNPSDFAWTADWEAADERIDKWYQNMQTVKESDVAPATFQMDYVDEVAFATKRWLFNRARDKARGQNAPFALVASFIHPHGPNVKRPEWWNLYWDEDIDVPAYVPNAEDQNPFSKRLMDGIEASYVPLSEEELRRARRAYLANVSYFDSKIGEIERTY